MENESDSYQQYLISVGRDGIPYQVICNTVPEIEKEVNSILSQVVDYTIQFETDGKNIIPYVVYEYGRWPIELTSGYERFVASVAIRVAFTNISNLPKTTWLAIDEGFGVLDSENMASLQSLFQYMKSNFDFIMIISHIDSMRDLVDTHMNIRKINGVSNVIF
jgi:DNA repair exonuclease SbcCD ATPase subunit